MCERESVCVRETTEAAPLLSFCVRRCDADQGGAAGYLLTLRPPPHLEFSLFAPQNAQPTRVGCA